MKCVVFDLNMFHSVSQFAQMWNIESTNYINLMPRTPGVPLNGDCVFRNAIKLRQSPIVIKSDPAAVAAAAQLNYSHFNKRPPI